MVKVKKVNEVEGVKYNGWSNRETWIVNLWLTNSECFYSELCRILSSFNKVYEQSDELERYIRLTITELNESSLVSDLLNTSLARVDWTEIVEANQD